MTKLLFAFRNIANTPDKMHIFIRLTYYTVSVLVNNQLDVQFFFSYIFIPVLYMFRATLCSSSGESVL